MNKLLTISPSPHNYGDDSTKKVMYGVIIAMVPAMLVSFFYFGLGAIVLTATAVISCLIFEYLIQKELFLAL